MKNFFCCALALAVFVSCGKDEGGNEEGTLVPKITGIAFSDGQSLANGINLDVDSDPVTITLSAEDADSYKWTLDGEEITSASGNSCRFSDTKWSGAHTLTVSLTNSRYATTADTSFTINVNGPYRGKLLAIGGEGGITVLNEDYSTFESDKRISGVSANQGAALYGNDLYVTVGGDNPLVIADPQTLKAKKVIEKGNSGDKETFPSCGTIYRTFKVDDRKAYIICAQSATIGGFQVVDLTERKVVRHVVVPKNIPELMCRLGDKVLGATSEGLYTVDPETDAVTPVSAAFGENRHVVGLTVGNEGEIYVAVGAEFSGMRAVAGSSGKIVRLNGTTFAVEKEYPLSGALLNAYTMGYTDGSGLRHLPGENALLFYGKDSFIYGAKTNVYLFDLNAERLTTISTGQSLGSAGTLDLSYDRKTVFGGFGSYSYAFYRFDLSTGTSAKLCNGNGYSAGSVIDLR